MFLCSNKENGSKDPYGLRVDNKDQCSNLGSRSVKISTSPM